MALVVLLRGVNVGGHRTFRPSVIAEQLKHLDVVSIGAAGTFVVRRPTTHAQLRAELASRLPFDVEIVICQAKAVVGLLSRTHHADESTSPEVVRFVSVLSRRPRVIPPLPVILPDTGRWLLKIVARDGRFVVGVYRRHMKVIGYLGSIDRLFGATAVTRNWSTVEAIANALKGTLGVGHARASPRVAGDAAGVRRDRRTRGSRCGRGPSRPR